jgi:hypothetical protein
MVSALSYRHMQTPKRRRTVNTRSRNSFRALGAVACGTLAMTLAITLSMPAAAQPEGIDPIARERLKMSLDYLNGLDAFTVSTHGHVEVVLLDGQKIQMLNQADMTLQRPNRLHARRLGEALEQELFYDGKSLTLHQPGDNVYATVPAPPTLEAALDFAREELDIVAPAGDLLDANAYEVLMEGVRSGLVVGTAMLDGVICDHLAFSAPGTDFQLWIEQGNRPLPRRMVITSRDVVNAPQFTVNLHDWDLDPKLSASAFRFEPPDGAVVIDFMPASGTP